MGSLWRCGAVRLDEAGTPRSDHAKLSWLRRRNPRHSWPGGCQESPAIPRPRPSPGPLSCYVQKQSASISLPDRGNCLGFCARNRRPSADADSCGKSAGWPFGKGVWARELHPGDEGTVASDVTISHTWRVKREPRVPFAVQQDESSSGMGAFRQKVNRFARDVHGCVRRAGMRCRTGTVPR
jgi:hypothetical protein